MIPRYKISTAAINIDGASDDFDVIQVTKYTLTSEELFAKYIRVPLSGYTAKLMRANHKIFYWEEFRSAIFINALNYIVELCAKGYTFHYSTTRCTRIIQPTHSDKLFLLDITSGAKSNIFTHRVAVLHVPKRVTKKSKGIVTIYDVIKYLLLKYYDVPHETLFYFILQGISELARCDKKKIKYCFKLKVFGENVAFTNRSKVFTSWDSLYKEISRGIKTKWAIKLKYRASRLKKQYIGLTEALYLMYLDQENPCFIPEGFVSISRDLLYYTIKSFVIILCDFKATKVFEKITNYEIDNPKFIFERDVDGYNTISRS